MALAYIMKQNHGRRRRKFAAWLAAWILTAWGMVFPPVLQSAEEPAKAELAVADISHIRQLMESAGVNAYLRNITIAEVAQDDKLTAVGLREEDANTIANIVQGSYDDWDYTQTVTYVFRNSWNAEHAATVRQWFDTHLGHRVLKSESQGRRVEPKTRESVMSKFLQNNPASKSRIESIKKLEAVQDLSGFTANTIQAESQLLVTLFSEQKKKMVEDLKIGLKGPLRSLLQSKHQISLLHLYQDLSDEELEKLALFAASPPGTWFYTTLMKGLSDAQANLIRRAVTSVSLLKEGRRTGQDVAQMAMRVFRPGVRYLFVSRRDPFQEVLPSKGISSEQLENLLTPSEVLLAKESEKDKPKVTKFGPELHELTPVFVEVLNQIKENNPGLYKDMKYYAALFKGRKELEAMSDSDYLNVVTNYKLVLDMARRQQESIILSPLQIDYSQLRLNGVVWNKTEYSVLVETPDKKGHSARKGAMIGPNFGVIESITEEKVAVIEKLQNYIGDEVVKKVELELFAAPPPDAKKKDADARKGKEDAKP